MLLPEDNELLTQTDRGTPMGELFRRFWIPVLLSEELPVANCTPVRFRILGEDLLGFRDSKGRVGIIDAYCPHRGAPLFHGRNEDSGLRCIYHGWKFDVDGTCLELPNVENGDAIKDRVHLIAYPNFEGAGMIWAYLGPTDRQPPVPEFPYLELAAENTFVTKYEMRCNWLQAQEGDNDPSHVQFLHSTLGSNGSAEAEIREVAAPKPGSPLPKIGLVTDSLIGQLRIATRDLGDGNMSVGGSQIVYPSFCSAGLSAPGVFSSNIRIPIDDENMWHFRLRWSPRGFTAEELAEFKYGGFIFAEHELGTWLPKGNKDNGYLQDRILQRHYNYTGITTFPNQDVMMIEDQRGPIMDRSKEFLVASDRPIIQQRERLLRLVKAIADGREPEEPFLLKGVRQQMTERIVVPNGDLNDEIIQQVVTSLNTELLGEASAV